METNVRLVEGQRTLALIWCVGAAIPFALLIFQTTVGNVFIAPGDKDLGDRVWEWFVPTLAPTVGLVLGVLANNELRDQAKRAAARRRVSRSFFRLTCGLSLFYLLIVAILPLATLAKSSAEQKVALLLGSHRFLPVLQGFVSVVLAVFFIGTEGTESSRDAGGT